MSGIEEGTEEGGGRASAASLRPPAHTLCHDWRPFSADTCGGKASIGGSSHTLCAASIAAASALRPTTRALIRLLTVGRSMLGSGPAAPANSTEAQYSEAVAAAARAAASVHADSKANQPTAASFSPPPRRPPHLLLIPRSPPPPAPPDASLPAGGRLKPAFSRSDITAGTCAVLSSSSGRMTTLAAEKGSLRVSFSTRKRLI
eukprot:scaffold4869_cov123-Isochrysis_galbana.AAC.7